MRWNEELDAEAAPDGLLEYGPQLGLTQTEMRLLICIEKFKRAETEPPLELLAGAMKEDVVTVDKTLQRIVRRGLLVIEQEMDGLVYDFTPLLAALDQVQGEADVETE